MRIEHIFIGIAVFIMVFALGLNLYNDQISKYSLTDNSDKFVKIVNESLDGTVIRLQKSTQDQTISTEDTESSAYKSNVPAVREIDTGVPKIINIITNYNTETGLIPMFIIDSFIWIIWILAMVFILYMFMRFKPQN